MDAVYRQRYHGGGLVPELLEYRAITEWGWTQREYDRADHARLTRALLAGAAADVLRRSDRGEELGESESTLLGRVLKGRGPAWSGLKGGSHG